MPKTYAGKTPTANTLAGAASILMFVSARLACFLGPAGTEDTKLTGTMYKTIMLQQ
jgi:hypothetical protein